MIADNLVNLKSRSAGLCHYRRQTSSDSFKIKATTKL